MIAGLLFSLIAGSPVLTKDGSIKSHIENLMNNRDMVTTYENGSKDRKTVTSVQYFRTHLDELSRTLSPTCVSLIENEDTIKVKNSFLGVSVSDNSYLTYFVGTALKGNRDTEKFNFYQMMEEDFNGYKYGLRSNWYVFINQQVDNFNIVTNFLEEDVKDESCVRFFTLGAKLLASESKLLTSYYTRKDFFSEEKKTNLK